MMKITTHDNKELKIPVFSSPLTRIYKTYDEAVLLNDDKWWNIEDNKITYVIDNLISCEWEKDKIEKFIIEYKNKTQERINDIIKKLNELYKEWSSNKDKINNTYKHYYKTLEAIYDNDKYINIDNTDISIDYILYLIHCYDYLYKDNTSGNENEFIYEFLVQYLDIKKNKLNEINKIKIEFT